MDKKTGPFTDAVETELVNSLAATLESALPSELPEGKNARRDLLGLCSRHLGDLLDNKVQVAVIEKLKTKLEL